MTHKPRSTPGALGDYPIPDYADPTVRWGEPFQPEVFPFAEGDTRTGSDGRQWVLSSGWWWPIMDAAHESLISAINRPYFGGLT